MILSGRTIYNRATQAANIKDEGRVLTTEHLLIEPFEPVKKQAIGMSYGLTLAGYDIRLGKLPDEVQSKMLHQGQFALCSSLERLAIPVDLLAVVHDKSTLARRGLALQNTVLEPGWRGHITLELSNHGPNPIRILAGMPIAQLLFHQVDRPTEGYKGKYQDQPDEPVEAIYEPSRTDLRSDPHG